MKKIFLIIAILAFSCSKDDMQNIQKPIATQVTYLSQDYVILDNARVVYDQKTGMLRDGGAASADLIFFRESCSSDNYLINGVTNDSIKREHKMYDKDDIAYLQLTLGLLNTINIDGVFHKHYKILIMYKDSSFAKIVAYSKEGPDNFKYIPTGENLLRSGHPSKVISWTATGQTKLYYNEVRFSNHTPPNGLKKWQLRMDGSPIKTEFKEPTSKNATQYQPAHKI